MKKKHTIFLNPEAEGLSFGKLIKKKCDEIERKAKEDFITVYQTGATRSPLGDKPEYAGYLSPLAIKAFGEYMLKHQQQEDGSRRDSRNWQKGIPSESYIQSMWRHFLAVWSRYESGENADIDELCALMFNVQGLLHETLKREGLPME